VKKKRKVALQEEKDWVPLFCCQGLRHRTQPSIHPSVRLTKQHCFKIRYTANEKRKEYRNKNFFVNSPF